MRSKLRRTDKECRICRLRVSLMHKKSERNVSDISGARRVLTVCSLPLAESPILENVYVPNFLSPFFISYTFCNFSSSLSPSLTSLECAFVSFQVQKVWDGVNCVKRNLLSWIVVGNFYSMASFVRATLTGSIIVIFILFAS